MTHSEEVAAELHDLINGALELGMEQGGLEHFAGFSIDAKRAKVEVRNDRGHRVLFHIKLCCIEHAIHSFMLNFKIATTLHALTGKQVFDMTESGVRVIDLSDPLP